jgi:DNA-binding CsgD family transcriptional regulator
MDIFERLGAQPWAALVWTELLAAGERRAPRPTGRALALTPQERQVARAVAAGATSAEAAAQRFVSPETVEQHLTSAYCKLGVRSRAQLVA